MSNSPFGQLTRRSQDHRTSRTLSKTLSSGRTRWSPGVAARPIAPADLAQARYFEAVLRAEICRLRGVVEGATPRRAKRSTDASTDLEADIREANRHINEADHLIGALRNRFPHRPVTGRLS